MKIITIRHVDLQFDADQITHGGAEQQADQTIDVINLTLQNNPPGLTAQIIAYRDEIEIETDHI